MLSWLRHLTRRDSAPLTGAPAVRRQKSYSARSGYVYQYFYEGQRPARRGRERGIEFVFAVSADRKTTFPVSVFVSEPAVRAWEAPRSRKLTSTEWYAIAKMSLFQAFDERPAPAAMHDEVRVRAADVEGILETFGLD